MYILCRSAAFLSSIAQDNTDRRQATTRDYDTRNADVLTFFFRIGGSGSCDSAEINEDVAIQASTDGGITWQNWRLLKYNQFPYVPLVRVKSDAATRMLNYQYNYFVVFAFGLILSRELVHPRHYRSNSKQ